nr:MAG TPA_asm: protein of unknown function (DUF5372) [Caudoviricetes sp.]
MFLNIHTHPFHPFTHRKKSFRDLDISFYDSKPTDLQAVRKSQKNTDLYFRKEVSHAKPSCERR